MASPKTAVFPFVYVYILEEMEINISCGFCAKLTNCSRLLNIFYLDIFKIDIFEKELNICPECAIQLQNCYAFVKRLEQVQKQLKLKKQSEVNVASTFQAIKPKDDFVLNESPAIERSEHKRLRRSYKCGECEQEFVAHRQLKAHVVECHPQTSIDLLICEYCCSLFANADDRQEHLKQQHLEPAKYICLQKECRHSIREYKTRGHLLNHVNKSHQGKSLFYYCTLCAVENAVGEPLKFENRNDLQTHFTSKHQQQSNNWNLASSLEEDVEELEFLDEFFLENEDPSCWDALDLDGMPEMLHIQGAYSFLQTEQTNPQDSSNSPTYKCPQCSEHFSKLKELFQHLSQSHEMTFEDNHMVLQCPYNCGKSFHAMPLLRQHLRVVHSLLKRHTCQLCDKQFATVDHLKKHVLSQHENERKHVCSLCLRSFTQLGHLKQHLGTVHAGKQMECQLCEVKFWRKIDLERHIAQTH